MPSRLQKAIGAVKDQTSINLAKIINNNTSSNLQVAVLKATTHDDSPIDDRYVYRILHLISSNKTYAAACARAIAKRITRTRDWIVALKSLMLVLRIFQDGDPYFPRELLHATKRGSRVLNLSDFCHRSGSNRDYAEFVRLFGLYLDERLDCFLTGKLQKRYINDEREGLCGFCERSNESVRDMKPSMLIDRIVHWQRLLGRAVATQPTGGVKDSPHRLVKMSLYIVVRESFDLYNDISDGLALLIDRFFHLRYESRVSTFRICVKAAKQFEELEKFYSVCKTIGVGRNLVYPTVQIVSGELIETLEEFLNEKSSFPLQTRNPNKFLVLPRAGLLSKRHKTHGEQSEFSGFGSPIESISDQTSESGSECKSEEDSDTTTKTSPYSPIDLLSLDDWPANKEQNPSSDNSRSGNGWELILPENVTPSSHTQFNDSQASTNPHNESGYCWELIPPETPTQHQTDISSNTFHASTTTTLHQPQLPPINHYNPFLQDPHDIPAVNSNPAPDFEASFPVNGAFLTSTNSPETTTAYSAGNQTEVVNNPFTLNNNPFAQDTRAEICVMEW